ncbi:hypothetical protein IWX47DRAFT_14889 [Phyllosticta citricarpa]
MTGPALDSPNPNHHSAYTLARPGSNRVAVAYLLLWLPPVSTSLDLCTLTSPLCFRHCRLGVEPATDSGSAGWAGTSNSAHGLPKIRTRLDCPNER